MFFLKFFFIPLNTSSTVMAEKLHGDSYNNWTLDLLVEHAKTHDLGTTGSKQDLWDLLMDFEEFCDACPPAYPPRSRRSRSRRSRSRSRSPRRRKKSKRALARARARRAASPRPRRRRRRSRSRSRSRSPRRSRSRSRSRSPGCRARASCPGFLSRRSGGAERTVGLALGPSGYYRPFRASRPKGWAQSGQFGC